MAGSASADGVSFLLEGKLSRSDLAAAAACRAQPAKPALSAEQKRCFREQEWKAGAFVSENRSGLYIMDFTI